MKKIKFYFALSLIICILFIIKCYGEKFQFNFRKGVPFISNNIEESKKYNLFLAKYKVESINISNFPIYIDEVWFERLAYYTEKDDSLEIYEDPLLTLSVHEKTDYSALVTLIGGATVSPFKDYRILKLHPFASGYKPDSFPSEINIPLTRSIGYRKVDTVGNIKLIRVDN